MSERYFSVERNGRYGTIVANKRQDSDTHMPDFMQMTYDEMKSNEYLELFIVAIMMDTNEAFGTNDEQTIVTLIDEDGIFVWGILIGPGEEDGDIRYNLIDWKKDGKNYRYEP
jgi:hypothetical protein